MHTQTSHGRIPAAFWWIVGACLLAYSWQHLAAQTVPTAPATSAAEVQPLPPQLADLLSKIDQTSQAASLDVARLRIEKWKADSSDKQQAQANADSLQRNMTDALPSMTGAVRAAPQDFAAAFKLYRNLNALYDVFKTLTEASASFSSKQDYQMLAPYADAIDGYRRALADHLETLSAAKDAELFRLRSQARSDQVTASPKKKIIINDGQPAPKKSTKKKSAKPAPPKANPQ